MQIVNLTPHTITLCGMAIKSSGVARCATVVEQIGEINGIKVNSRRFGEVYGLPDEKDGTIYIVSSLVAQAVKGARNDVYIVDETIRDDAGNIVGCNALAKV